MTWRQPIAARGSCGQSFRRQGTIGSSLIEYEGLAAAWRGDLEGMLVSYESVVTQRIHRGIVEHVIPGVLKSYDLPDLVSKMAPRRVRLADLSDPVGQLVPIEKARALYPRSEVTRRRPESGAAQLWQGLF